MSVEKFFESIYRGSQSANLAQDLAGRVLGGSWAIVSDINDPLKQGRVRVSFGDQGGNSKSGWLIRVLPWKFLSVPIPSVGDLVLVGYPDGNRNADGWYWGFAQNLLNPAEQSGVSWTYLWDSLKVVLNQTGVLIQLGDCYINLQYDEFLELGWMLSRIRIKKAEIQITSPSIKIGSTPDTLEDMATWSNSTINFPNAKVLVHNKEVCVIGGEDEDSDVFVISGQ